MRGGANRSYINNGHSPLSLQLCGGTYCVCKAISICIQVLKQSEFLQDCYPYISFRTTSGGTAYGETGIGGQTFV